MLRILTPGLQASLQGAPRIGGRHFGIPYAGPADPVSMALANRLVGNSLEATAIEITFGGFEAEVEAPCSIAFAGAASDLTISGHPATLHRTLNLKAGDRLQLTPPTSGCRTYLAIKSGFQSAQQFGSTSTYLPAGFGGHHGRALQAGDKLVANGNPVSMTTRETPESVRPVFTRSFALRACRSAETDMLSPSDQARLFDATFSVGRQATRMGLSLTGIPLFPQSDGMMKSAPVFPGAIQCPPSGIPIILLCDAQTTGGYPRIAHIARCDRHLLGQARPGDEIRLLHRAPDAAITDFKHKQALLETWLKP